MTRKNKKKLAFLGMPILYTAIAIGLYVLGFGQMWNLVYDQWKAAMIKGAPEYSYESMIDTNEQTKDGILYYGEVGFPEEGGQLGELICESIEMKVPLYCGDSPEILEKGAGVYTAGSMPGEAGTILAGAHDSTYFSELEKLKVSDIITVKTTYGIFEYRVFDIRIVDMSCEEWEIQEAEEQLALYTCYPFGSTDEVRTQRYFVWAEKISGPEIKEAG